MLPTKFRFIWPSGFRGEDFKKSANQKQELPVVAMFVNGSGRNEQSLYRTFHRCFLPNLRSIGFAVSDEKIKMWKVIGRQTTDAKWWQKLTLPLARWAKNDAFLCCVLHSGIWYDWECIFLECLRVVKVYWLLSCHGRFYTSWQAVHLYVDLRGCAI